MDIERINILIKGTLSSGSSAVKDLLKEYRDVNVIPDEFNFFRLPGLVADQLNCHSRIDYENRIDEVTKINRIEQRLFKSIAPAKFWGNKWDNKFIQYLKNKTGIIHLNQIQLLDDLNELFKSNISLDEKIQYSNIWIRKVGSFNGLNKHFVLFDQPLFPGSDLEIWTKVFRPYKLICVFREPKDQLTDMIKRGVLFSPFSSPEITYTSANILSIYGKDRKGMMRFMIDALKKRIEEFDNLQELLDPDKILLIDYEGLITNYEYYKSVIEDFLGLPNEYHEHKKMYFNPEASEQNIGQYKNIFFEEEIDGLHELEEWYSNKVLSQKKVYETLSLRNNK